MNDLLAVVYLIGFAAIGGGAFALMTQSLRRPRVRGRSRRFRNPECFTLRPPNLARRCSTWISAVNGLSFCINRTLDSSVQEALKSAIYPSSLEGDDTAHLSLHASALLLSRHGG